MTSAADARLWIGGFEAAERAATEARRRRGVDARQSIAISLSLIEAARTAFGGRFPRDRRRDAQDAVVRAAWAQLRARERR